MLKRWQRSEAPISQSIETRENQRREGCSRSHPWVIAQDCRVRSGLEAAKRASCNSNLHNSRAGATHFRALFIFGVKSSVSKESLERQKFTIEILMETSLTLVMASDSTRSSTIKGNFSLCRMATSVLSIQWKVSRTAPHSAPWIARAAFSNIAIKLAREFLFQAQVRSMRSRSGRMGLTCDLLPAGERVP